MTRTHSLSSCDRYVAQLCTHVHLLFCAEPPLAAAPSLLSPFLCRLLFPVYNQILPELYAQAVARADGGGAGAGAGREMMRFVTKLNGKHVWKWQIASTDTFAKVGWAGLGLY